MAVYDRWHTLKPRIDPETKKPAEPCRHSTKTRKLYASAAHEKGPRWQVRWYDREGKQCARNFEKKEGKDPGVHADAWWAKVSNELKADTYIDPAAGEVSFQSYAEQIIRDRSIEDTTRQAMRQDFGKHVYPRIGHLELRTLSKTPSIVQGLVAHLEKKAKLDPVTIGLIMRRVSLIFACAIEDEKITKNPVKSKLVTLPKKQQRKVVPWTRAQLAAVRAELPGRFRAMIDAGAGLGLRPGEVFAFSPEDIDMWGMALEDIEWLEAKPEVHIRRQIKRVRGADGRSRLCFDLPKGEKVRDLRIPKAVWRALAEHAEEFPPVEITLPWKSPDGELVTVLLFFVAPAGQMGQGRFVRAEDGPIQKAWFYEKVWGPALLRAGIRDEPDPDRKAPAGRDGNGPQCLRHYFASACLAGGEGVAAVAEWMGHHSPVITLDIYGHLLPDRDHRLGEIIDAALDFDHEQGALDVHSEDRP